MHANTYQRPYKDYIHAMNNPYINEMYLPQMFYNIVKMVILTLQFLRINSDDYLSPPVHLSQQVTDGQINMHDAERAVQYHYIC